MHESLRARAIALSLLAALALAGCDHGHDHDAHGGHGAAPSGGHEGHDHGAHGHDHGAAPPAPTARPQTYGEAVAALTRDHAALGPLVAGAKFEEAHGAAERIGQGAKALADLATRAGLTPTEVRDVNLAARALREAESDLDKAVHAGEAAPAQAAYARMAPALATLTGFVEAATGTLEAADLERYLAIGAVLAADKTEGVADHAKALAGSSNRAIARAASALAPVGGDLEPARRAFHDLSRAALSAAKATAAKGSALPKLHWIECTMTDDYGHWLQREETTANPYHGSRMLRCGIRRGTVGG